MGSSGEGGGWGGGVVPSAARNLRRQTWLNRWALARVHRAPREVGGIGGRQPTPGVVATSVALGSERSEERHHSTAASLDSCLRRSGDWRWPRLTPISIFPHQGVRGFGGGGSSAAPPPYPSFLRKQESSGVGVGNGGRRLTPGVVATSVALGSSLRSERHHSTAASLDSCLRRSGEWGRGARGSPPSQFSPIKGEEVLAAARLRRHPPAVIPAKAGIHRRRSGCARSCG